MVRSVTTFSSGRTHSIFQYHESQSMGMKLSDQSPFDFHVYISSYYQILEGNQDQPLEVYTNPLVNNLIGDNTFLVLVAVLLFCVFGSVRYKAGVLSPIFTVIRDSMQKSCIRSS